MKSKSINEIKEFKSWQINITPNCPKQREQNVTSVDKKYKVKKENDFNRQQNTHLENELMLSYIFHIKIHNMNQKAQQEDTPEQRY